MEQLTEILFVVSTGLLVPVVVVLLLLAASSVFALGGFGREAFERRHVASPGELSEAIASGRPLAGEAREPVALFVRRARQLGVAPPSLEPLLDEMEIDLAARLSSLSLRARLGPMLGLMGTLIPLGPALLGLGDGRVEELAAGLVVAFSTTVVGLLVGVLCACMLHARRHWYARDLHSIEQVCLALDARGQA
ncbi:MotA/TolQ/ExbB proton channel family protein [Engelhardtia mirabilis]|uniref:MotA/TolQ/ExbB proton channel family protein n=1 Tax=Engelhardtia mirabilis TaxID=2528011 RepID=A0A518BJF8_9BACT|nr:MotA/TolQ/ExbB proton channel family protein [Planctomycetes bacterium Pla133]QDV01412.1 MotA/TolQ/ExbB proton channel family protein [Planctomycetes bacterium Pla86]